MSKVLLVRMLKCSPIAPTDTIEPNMQEIKIILLSWKLLECSLSAAASYGYVNFLTFVTPNTDSPQLCRGQRTYSQAAPGIMIQWQRIWLHYSVRMLKTTQNTLY